MTEQHLREAIAKSLREVYPEVPEHSDEEVALVFAGKYMGRLLFVDVWGHWLAYDGRRWEPERTLLARDLVRKTCREASQRAKDGHKDRLSAEIASKSKVAAVEYLARSDRLLAATADQWDRDPWLFNCPGGTIDLRTGKMHEHRPADFITRIAAVSPEEVECREWQKFLERVTGGDREQQAFLRRMAGYALTGSTREHALFFLFGTGANGKSVFVNTLIGLLGDYAMVAPIETFTAARNEQHPTELARLRGARLVAAIETEQGRRWSESRIKTLTGGDKIAARYMWQDFFEFTPELKLLIAGNHRPALRGVDEGIRRRMNLVPFTVTIPPGERDDSLSDRLRAEWPAILHWAIDGCAEWQGESLAPPECVRLATESYLAGEDALGQWLEECCEVREGFYALAKELYGSWSKWAEKAGELVGSQKRLSQILEDRGFIPKRQAMTGRHGFSGIALRIEYDEPTNPQ